MFLTNFLLLFDFIDDSLPVLRSALQYGISRLFAVLRPDTCQPPREPAEFPMIESFKDIMPAVAPAKEPHLYPEETIKNKK